jgi:hypothetical protein
MPSVGSWLRLVRALPLDPLWAGAFNVVGGCYIPPHQDTLMTWYVTAKPCRVSVCVSGFVTQAGSSGLVDAVPALSLEGSQFS